MNEVIDELKKNYDWFSNKLDKQLKHTFSSLNTHEDIFQGSYNRLASLESWKAYLFEIVTKDDSSKFFIEAQNDALLSHLLCRIGSWRASLQCLRACIENILFFIYYKDHPIELKLWDVGKNKLPISDYLNYYYDHPNHIVVPANIDSKVLLKAEYSTLSKAVHGSSVSFRMTKEDDFPSIMLPKIERLNMGMSREKSVLFLINLMFINLFVDHLQGAKLRELRKIISLSIPEDYHDAIKNSYGIKLFKQVST